MSDRLRNLSNDSHLKSHEEKYIIISNTFDYITTIPLDSFPIESTKTKSTFNVQISHQIPTYTSPIPDNCDEHLSCKPEWIQQLI